MKTLSRAEAAGFFLVHDDFTILTHSRPDGDTAGSAAALCRGLRLLGKHAWILENPELTSRYTWLHQGLTKEEAGENDTLVAVDIAATNLIPKAFSHLTEKIALRLDHHATGMHFAPQELVDSTSASCAELVCDVLTILGIQPDKDIATAVYVGLATDTGCFRYANTNAHTFRVASLCMASGADIFALNQQLFETNSLSKLRLHAWMTEHMEFFDDGRMVIVAIPRLLEDQLGCTEDDMDNISSFPRTVAGVCMAATLRQSKSGQTKISLRAVPGYDAAAVCGEFGGGGHAGAAGASSALPLEEAVRAVKDAMLRKGACQ